MKPKKNATSTSAEVEILRVEKGSMEFCLLGSTPLILNRLAMKARRELLLPRKKTGAEKASTLKHNPPQEFDDAPDKLSDPKAPTLLAIPGVCFKKAMGSAALDIPDSPAKAQIGRLVTVAGAYLLPIYGIPKLHMAITRSADMNRTPDVRTRVIIPQWAAKVTIQFIVPILRPKSVANLLAAAGIMSGVGDWRVQKGSGDYGQFEIVEANDPRFLEVVKHGRRAQEVAMEAAIPFDDQTKELLSWFHEEVERRGFAPATGPNRLNGKPVKIHDEPVGDES